MNEDNVPEKEALSGGRTDTFTQKKTVKIYRHVIVALVLFLAFAIAMDSLGAAFFICLFAVIWYGTRREKNGYAAKIKLIIIGAYAVLLIMAFVVKNINNRVAYENAKIVIAACEQYKIKKGAYPDRLNDLVPGYLTRIPVARYTGITGWKYFHHPNKGSTEDDHYSLQFTYEPPFGRRVYHSQTKKWRSMD
jgi:hypothetical protein